MLTERSQWVMKRHSWESVQNFETGKVTTTEGTSTDSCRMLHHLPTEARHIHTPCVKGIASLNNYLWKALSTPFEQIFLNIQHLHQSYICRQMCWVRIKCSSKSFSFLKCGIQSLAWWRHQMEAFSALLALCAGTSPVTAEFPQQRPVTQSFEVSLICTWINGWVNSW